MLDLIDAIYQTLGGNTRERNPQNTLITEIKFDFAVFNFLNGSDNVAVVTKQVFDSCNITSTLAVLNSTPANIALNATGEHYYTSTYDKHCILGQKLVINVTGHTTPGSGPSPPATAHPPSKAVSPSPPATAHPPSNAASPSPAGGALAPSPKTSAAPIGGRLYFGTFMVSVVASALYF